ncbi:hypothetical protein PRNP1_000402 [Phytophthora ramorum]
MKAISAHVTGFYRSSFHAYTTEVTVDGHRWRLGLRYSKFHDFYDQLLLLETDFHFAFPPKGSLFFTPKPEERQEQLEEFLQQVLSYYAARGYPSELEDLLCELLKVPRHLKSPEHEDDDVSTSTESVLDEPLHEPPTVDKEPLQDEKDPETEKVQEAVQESTEEEELPVDKEKEAAAVADGTVQLEKPRPVEAEMPVVHEDTETQKETPAPVEETQVTVEEDPARIEDEETEEGEVEAATPHVPVEEAATETGIAEQSAEEEAAVETRPEEPVEVSPEVQQPVVEPIVKKEESVAAKAQLPQTPVQPLAAKESGVAVPNEKEGHKEIDTSGRVSSWIAAYLPESLLGFIRRRCLKKTNLVVLCVALLLPMVLARR